MVAWWSWRADVTFLGGNSPLENKPGVEGKKYDGSDINPEDRSDRSDRSKEIQFYKLIRRIFACLQCGFIVSDFFLVDFEGKGDV